MMAPTNEEREVQQVKVLELAVLDVVHDAEPAIRATAILEALLAVICAMGQTDERGATTILLELCTERLEADK